jgi:hypothetical protein
MRTSQSPRPGMGLLGRGAAVRFSLVSRLTTLGDVRHPGALLLIDPRHKGGGD